MFKASWPNSQVKMHPRTLLSISPNTAKYTEITVCLVIIKLTFTRDKITFKLLQKIGFDAMNQFLNCDELDLFVIGGYWKVEFDNMTNTKPRNRRKAC